MPVYNRSRFFLRVGGSSTSTRSSTRSSTRCPRGPKKDTAHGGLWKCDGGSQTPKTVTPTRAQVCKELEKAYEISQF